MGGNVGVRCTASKIAVKVEGVDGIDPCGSGWLRDMECDIVGGEETAAGPGGGIEWNSVGPNWYLPELVEHIAKQC